MAEPRIRSILLCNDLMHPDDPTAWVLTIEQGTLGEADYRCTTKRGTHAALEEEFWKAHYHAREQQLALFHDAEGD